MELYRWFYIRLGGRRWTYILRDAYHNFEFFVIVGGVILGYYLYFWVSPLTFWVGIGGISLGFILGHLFWGKRWIPGQRE